MTWTKEDFDAFIGELSSTMESVFKSNPDSKITSSGSGVGIDFSKVILDYPITLDSLPFKAASISSRRHKPKTKVSKGLWTISEVTSPLSEDDRDDMNLRSLERKNRRGHRQNSKDHLTELQLRQKIARRNNSALIEPMIKLMNQKRVNELRDQVNEAAGSW